MQNFTYIIKDEDTDFAIIVDPSWDIEDIQKIIEKNKKRFTKNERKVWNHYS